MLRTLLIATTAFTLLFSTLYAQSSHRSPTTISMGILGYNQILGANVDQLLLRKPNFNLGVRLGLPLHNPLTKRAIMESKGKSISTGLNLIVGKYSSHFDFGMNVNFLQDTYGPDRNGEIEYGTATVYRAFVGYRYQKPEGGLFLRAGYCPGFSKSNGSTSWLITSILPMLDFGCTLPNGFKNLRESTRSERLPIEKKEVLEFKNRYFISVGIGIQPTLLRSRKAPYYGGQGGGTSFYLESKLPTFSFSGGIQFDAWLRPHFGLELDLELTRERLDFAWATRSWSLLSTGIHTTAANLDMALSSLRIPLFAKFRFGDEARISVLAGPYLSYLLNFKADGLYNGVPVQTDDIPNIGFKFGSLNPPKSRAGFATGFEIHQPLRNGSFVLMKVRAGRDFSKLFEFPPSGISWLGLQVGYGIEL